MDLQMIFFEDVNLGSYQFLFKMFIDQEFVEFSCGMVWLNINVKIIELIEFFERFFEIGVEV